MGRIVSAYKLSMPADAGIDKKTQTKRTIWLRIRDSERVYYFC
jgi:hypothetical protein